MFELEVIDVRRYVQAFWRRKWIIVMAFCLAVAGTIGLHFWLNPAFEATTVIQLGSSRFITDELDKTVRGVTETPKRFRRENEKRIGQQEINRKFLLALADSLNFAQDSLLLARATEVHNDFPGYSFEEIKRDLMVKWLSQKISIYMPRASNLVYVTGKSSSPLQAYQIAKFLGSIYIQDYRERELSAIQSSHRFSLQQVAKFRSKLRVAEEQLRRFQSGLMTEKLNTYQVSAENLGNVNKAITSLKLELRRLTKSRTDLQAGITAAPVLTPSNRYWELRAGLIDRIADFASLAGEFDLTSREHFMLRKEIGEIRSTMRVELEKSARQLQLPPEIRDRVVTLELTKVDIEFTRLQLNEVENLLALFEAKETSAPSNTLALTRLQGEVEKYRKLIDMFESQVIGSEIEKNLQTIDAESRYRIVEDAVKPFSSSSFGLKTRLLIGATVGFGLGIGLILMLEYFDQSFKTVEQIQEYLGLSVLGTIPKMALPQPRKRLVTVVVWGTIISSLVAVCVFIMYQQYISP